MVLSSFVQRRRSCVFPLMATLVVSWCLLLCASIAQAEPHGDIHVAAEAPVHEAPCHGANDNHASAEETHAQDCPNCDAQPEQAGSGSAPQVILHLVDWFGSLLAPQTPTYTVAIHPNPPPPPSDRLHLVKGVFLI
ncbi:hypothetical protein [Marinimicrobium sp. ABcell2]|uniref:hypothetical protein n=1 Tax=Marinimicrobium sp. ABcell2 TaxID=3069751 RepID=UPI0027B498B2|nr:hypothetical protein [Marinimicrobium sp. ABcell2]MDQ2077088.1 hypothetical protein [Marinimicrobium sp. ABcell2]